MKLNLMNESGFTLIEALIALMLSSVILLLLTSGILQADKIKDVIISDSQRLSDNPNQVIGDRQMEWHLFLNQLEIYLMGTKNPEVYKDNIKLDEWDEEEQKYVEVRYDRRGLANNFTRSKKRGYNRMLTGIATINLQKVDGWLLLDFTFRNGDNYQGRIWVESWVEIEEIIPEDGEDI